MKKWIIIFCFFLCSCSTSNEVMETNQYQQLMSRIENTTTFDDKKDDFSIKVIFSQLDNGYRYDVILDSVKINMYDIKMIAYSSDSMDQYQPCIGLFDTNTYSLLPGKVDKSNGYYKGIQLSGKVTHKSSVIIYISYYSSMDKNYQEERILKEYEN